LEAVKNRKYILALSTTAYFLAAYMITSINIALPAIQTDLQVPATLLSWIGTSYSLTSTMSLLIFGRLADIYGRKKYFIAGLIGMIVSSLLVMFVRNVGMFIVLRCIQGFFGGMIGTIIVAIATTIFPLAERGKVLGILVAATNTGRFVGPFVSGMLVSYFHWKAIFVLTVLVALVSLLLTLRYLEGEWAPAAGDKMDVPGTVVYALILTMLIYGVTLLPAFRGIILCLLGVTGLFIFYNHQKRVKQPLIDVSIFRNNRILVFSNISTIINFAGVSAVIFLISLYLQYIKGLSPQIAGLIILVPPAVQVFFSTLSGKLSDRYRPGAVATTGMAVSTLSLFSFTFIKAETPIIIIMIGLILMGIGVALFGPPNMNAVMSSVEQQHYGTASALVATTREFGSTWSMALATMVISFYIGDSQITPATYSLFLKSSRLVFIMCTIMLAAGILLSLFTKEPAGKPADR